MKTFLLAVCLLAIVLPVIAGDFLSDQKEFPRVKEAYAEKEEMLTKALLPFDLTLSNLNILIVAYKNEKEFLVYGKKATETTYQKLFTYDICKSSGQPGPKRKQGDKQVPEGFYSINIFNPTSDYYLSLGINYPNASDSVVSTAPNKGGDIYIHGNCLSVGCLPVTDDKIKEIYVLAVQAHANGQANIPVYIFPFKFSDANVAMFTEQYKADDAMVRFWNTLKKGSDVFQRTMEEVPVNVDGHGEYVFQ